MIVHEASNKAALDKDLLARWSRDMMPQLAVHYKGKICPNLCIYVYHRYIHVYAVQACLHQVSESTCSKQPSRLHVTSCKTHRLSCMWLTSNEKTSTVSSSRPQLYDCNQLRGFHRAFSEKARSCDTLVLMCKLLAICLSKDNVFVQYRLPFQANRSEWN